MTSPFQSPSNTTTKTKTGSRMIRLSPTGNPSQPLPENDKSDDDCPERGMIEKLRRYLSYRHVFP